MKWKPIETAPEKGVFLVWLAAPKFESHVYPMRRNDRVTLVGTNFAFDMPRATHWMPLPSPPEGAP